MILIVESGSTKADWILVDSNGFKSSFKTKGWNLMLLSKEEMSVRLSLLSKLEPYRDLVKSIFFYTPGVALENSVSDLNLTLSASFGNAKIHIESDLLSAAHAAYKGAPLFVSILGTGANTAFYDGEELQQTSPSLGYVLGDEGSGAALGKLVLKAYLYQSLPKDLYLHFSKSHSISKENVLKAVYTQEAPNRFLASYVPFLVTHKSHQFIRSLVKEEFRNYFETHLNSNILIKNYPITFVGSVAFLFQEFIIELCTEYLLMSPSFIRNPSDNLVAFHSGNRI